MKYNIVHRTVYEYAAPVAVSHHVARLEPRVTGSQECENFCLKIFPEPTLQKSRRDYFGNRLSFFAIQELHSKLEVISHSRVSVAGGTPKIAPSSQPWETVAKMFCDPVAPEAIEPYQFVFDSTLVRASAEFADYALESFTPHTPLLAGARDLTRRIFRDFKYNPKTTTVATPVAEVWRNRTGVCQDFAHLAIACMRSLGLAARYVSGYLRTHPPEGAKMLVGADASHAWFSVYCPGTGWVDFDPTNDIQPADEHITVAYGRDFGDVSPVAGIITGGGAHALKVSVDVTPAT